MASRKKDRRNHCNFVVMVAISFLVFLLGYAGYIKDIPASLRLMSVEELNRFDVIVFGDGDASVLLGEINRTGLCDNIKQAIENGLIFLEISAGSMIAAGNFSDGQTVLIKGERKAIIS